MTGKAIAVLLASLTLVTSCRGSQHPASSVRTSKQLCGLLSLQEVADLLSVPSVTARPGTRNDCEFYNNQDIHVATVADIDMPARLEALQLQHFGLQELAPIAAGRLFRTKHFADAYVVEDRKTVEVTVLNVAEPENDKLLALVKAVAKRP